MNNKNILLIIAGLLIFVGLTKPTFINNLINNPSPITINDNLDIAKPSDDKLVSKANDVIKALSQSEDRKKDGKELAKLYLDIAKLISLDGENEIIRNTEEIRQANRVSGLMLNLDIKGKYKNLAEASKDLVVAAIGDDSVPLDAGLREKSVEAFKALAWAFYEGSK